MDLTFACGLAAKDLDPMTHILYFRISTLRRMLAKHVAKQVLVKLIIKRYSNQALAQNDHVRIAGSPFTRWEQTIENNNSDDDFAASDNSCDNTAANPMGPVGMLMSDPHACGWTMGQDLILRAEGETPHRHMEYTLAASQKAIHGIAARANDQELNSKRIFLDEIWESVVGS